MIKAIIFDCFGVIVADCFQVMRAELRSKDPATADQVDDLMHANHRGLIPSEECSRQIAALFGTTLAEFRAVINEGEVKDAELIKYIKSLRSHYKTALLSNIGAKSLRQRFSDGELLELFDTVVVSGEVGYAKPEPQIYEIAAARLGLRYDECFFTDDNAQFCEAARSVGMESVQYTTLGQFKMQLQPFLTSV
jgi:HAD superfamily hydrolase (TIGR01509 family)